MRFIFLFNERITAQYIILSFIYSFLFSINFYCANKIDLRQIYTVIKEFREKRIFSELIAHGLSENCSLWLSTLAIHFKWFYRREWKNNTLNKSPHLICAQRCIFIFIFFSHFFPFWSSSERYLLRQFSSFIWCPFVCYLFVSFSLYLHSEFMSELFLYSVCLFYVYRRKQRNHNGFVISTIVTKFFDNVLCVR